MNNKTNSKLVTMIRKVAQAEIKCNSYFPHCCCLLHQPKRPGNAPSELMEKASK